MKSLLKNISFAARSALLSLQDFGCRNLFFNIANNLHFYQLSKKIKIDKIAFDTKNFDTEIENIAEKIYQKYQEKFVKWNLNSNFIGAMATEIYNTGGHSECIFNFLKSFYKEYKCYFFLTKKNISLQNISAEKNNFLKNHILVDGIDIKDRRYIANIIEFYNQIASSNIKILFLYVHMDDLVAAAVASLLKKYTDIKIIFFNHASHYPTLSMKFADLIIECQKSIAHITKTKRGYDNTIIIGLQSKAQNETKYYSSQEIIEKHAELGIKPGNYMTLSGFASYKIFENNNSEYLKLIKNLLIKEPKLQHVLLTNFSAKEKKIFDEIFADNIDAKNRFIIHPLVSEFDIFLQACDLFIDSFPIGSALVHIDMMRNKKPTIVKINTENSIYSFHEYLPENYPYMFKTVNEIQYGILKLLHDKEEQNQISKILYSCYLENYEFAVVKQKYKKIIDQNFS